MYETFLLLIFMNIAAKVILSSLTLGFFAGTLARPTDGSVNREKRVHPFLLSLAEFRDVVNDLKVKKEFYFDVRTYTCPSEGYKTVGFLFVGDSKKNLLLASSDFPCLAEKNQVAQRALFKMNTDSPMAAMRKAITVLTHQKRMGFDQLFWLDIPGGITLPGSLEHSNSILELIHRPVTNYQSVEKKQSKERKKFYLHMRKFHQGLDLPTLAVDLNCRLTRPLDKLTKIETTVEDLVNERVTWIANNYEKDELEEFKIKGSKGLTLVFHDERNLVLFQKQGRKRILSPKATSHVTKSGKKLSVREGGIGWTAVGYQVQLPKMKNMGKITSIMVVPQRINHDKPDWEGFWVQVLSKKGILWLPICKQNLQRVSKQLDREIREMG